MRLKFVHVPPRLRVFISLKWPPLAIFYAEGTVSVSGWVAACLSEDFQDGIEARQNNIVEKETKWGPQ